MKLCPTCGGSPGKRNWLAASRPSPGGPIDIEMCEDPLHDAADRVGEIEAEVARLREALEEVLACIKLDPTMDGSIRPRGFTVEVIEAIRTARTALAPAAQKDNDNGTV